jgi:hypothetical protein
MSLYYHPISLLYTREDDDNNSIATSTVIRLAIQKKASVLRLYIFEFLRCAKTISKEAKAAF